MVFFFSFLWGRTKPATLLATVPAWKKRCDALPKGMGSILVTAAPVAFHAEKAEGPRVQVLPHAKNVQSRHN